MGLLPALRAFERMQHLVALIDARTRLVLAREGGRVVYVADDAPVRKPQFRREVELDGHARATAGDIEGSGGTTKRRRFRPGDPARPGVIARAGTRPECPSGRAGGSRPRRTPPTARRRSPRR